MQFERFLGFLWDDGYMQQLVRKVDPTLALDMVASWLNIMNVEGWIPREVVLGLESEARIPREYLVQSDDASLRVESNRVTLEYL